MELLKKIIDGNKFKMSRAMHLPKFKVSRDEAQRKFYERTNSNKGKSFGLLSAYLRQNLYTCDINNTGGIKTKFLIAHLMLSFCLLAGLASSISSESIEATTAITLPVDSVTIYPDGLMAVKRMGSLDLTEGTHKFVVNVPKKVSNATMERVVYDGNPVYTLNLAAGGSGFCLELSNVRSRFLGAQVRSASH